MTKKEEYTIELEPNWVYEAASFWNEIYQNNDELVIQNHEHYGMTKDQMSQYLAKYIDYKQKVTPKMKDLLLRYPNISFLFVPFHENSSIISALYFYINQLTDRSTKEEIDEAICRFIKNLVVNHGKDSIDEDDITLLSVSDVIQALGKTTIEDKYKFHLISLYSERYQAIPEIIHLLQDGGELLKQYQDEIIDQHQECIKTLQQQDEISLNRLKTKLDVPTTVFACIFPFNQISVQRRQNHQLIYMGMYASFLTKQKEVYRYQSEDVITALKALADPTRLKIIALLVNKPMYLQEIANELELSPATISHHVNLLISSAFINIVFDPAKSKKVYYETNSKGLQDIASVIDSFAKKGD